MSALIGPSKRQRQSGTERESQWHIVLTAAPERMLRRAQCPPVCLHLLCLEFLLLPLTTCSKTIHSQCASLEDHCRRKSCGSEGERSHTSQFSRGEWRFEHQVDRHREWACNILTWLQAEQCCETTLSLHSWRTHTFWAD